MNAFPEKLHTVDEGAMIRHAQPFRSRPKDHAGNPGVKRSCILVTGTARSGPTHCTFWNPLIIFLISFLFLTAPFPAEANGDMKAKAAMLFRRGEELLAQRDTLSALGTFREAARLDRKNTEVHCRLAGILLDIGTLDARLEAKWALEEALRIEPQNTAAMHAMVRWFFGTGMEGAARRMLNRIVSLDPRNAEAYYLIGLSYDGDWIRFEDMISPQFSVEGEFVMNFRTGPQAARDRDMAFRYYSKAIACDSSLSDAYYRIALIHFEMRNYQEMILFLKKAARKNPQNKDYPLFLGLAFQKLGRMEEAAAWYERAKKVMPDEERALLEDVSLVSTPEESALVQEPSRESRPAVNAALWKKRDPLFLTETNERMMEHYGRFAYACLRFGMPAKGVGGWQTDQGKIFIRYGSPEYMQKTRPDMKCESYALWEYPNFSFSFVDRSLGRNFQLTIPGRETYEELIRKRPDMSDPVPVERMIALSCSEAHFMDADGNTVTEIYQTLPQYAPGIDMVRNIKTLKRGIFLFDSSWKEVYRDISTGPYLYAPFESSVLIGWHRLSVLPGKYHLAVEYLDRTGSFMGRYRDTLSVESFRDPRLALSDPVLAREIGEYIDPGELRRGGVRIVPNTLYAYETGSSVLVYFEVYHLTFTPEGQTRYTVHFILEEAGKEGFTARIRSLFMKKREGKVTSSFPFTGTRQNEVLYQNIDLQNKEPKDYMLTVKVEDMNTRESVQKTIGFSLMKPGSE